MTKSELKLLIREAVEEVTKMENPCWKGYTAYGTKKKNGKEVPNCVPVNEKEDFGDQLKRELRNAIKTKNAEKAVYYKQALNSPTVAVAGFDKQFKGSWAYDQWLKKNSAAIAAQEAEFKRFAYMGETVSEEPSVNEAMSGEEYAKDIQTSKGVFKYWIEEDREPDNIKLFYYVKGPDGKVHDVDMNPYEYNPYSPENIEKVKNWIESGMPKTKIKETEGEDCPHCNNQGWYAVSDKYTGEPAQEQCEWCYTNPKSKFNVDKEDLEEYYESPKWDMIPEGDEHTCEGNEFYEMYGDFNADAKIEEAEYRGRKVKLGVPMKGDVKKSKVYVKNPKGNVVKVNFGDKKMRIKKSIPKRRKSFRARHNCANPGPRHKARYWSCRAW